MLSSALMAAGFEVDEAGDGAAGRALAESRPYDLLVIDVMLPIEDGISVARKLMTDKRYTPSHMVLMTNLARETMKVEAEALGIKECWIKDEMGYEQIIERVKLLVA